MLQFEFVSIFIRNGNKIPAELITHVLSSFPVKAHGAFHSNIVARRAGKSKRRKTRNRAVYFDKDKIDKACYNILSRKTVRRTFRKTGSGAAFGLLLFAPSGAGGVHFGGRKA
jgi:hypothetical protein